MLHVRAVTRVEEWDALTADWNALLDPAVPESVFAAHEWVRNWFDAFGADRTPYILIASTGGTLQAVLPLCAGRDRFAGLPLRRLDGMANGHSPRADFAVRSGMEEAAIEAFASFLRDREGEWDLAVLPEVVAGSPLARVYDAFPAEARHQVVQRRPPYLELAGDWDAVRAGLSKNFQRALRNNRNRIARAGEAVVETLRTTDEMLAALADVFAIGERSWQGEGGSAVGSSDANRAFYTGLVRAFGPQDRIRLYFLRLAGRRVAFELHVRHAGVEYGLKTGYDRDFETVGAGTFLDQSIVEALCSEGVCREYDLLGDADSYKLRWTSKTRDVVRSTLFGAGGQARLLSIWNLRLKPVLKQARARARRNVGAATAAPDASSSATEVAS